MDIQVASILGTVNREGYLLMMVRVQTGLVTMETSVEALQKARNKFTMWSSYSNLGHTQDSISH